MVKFVKKILHKIYLIGKYEDSRLIQEQKMEIYSTTTEIHPTVFISPSSIIENSNKNKSNIKIGAYTRVMGDIYTFPFSGEIVIGSYCFIGPLSKVWSAKKIQIGDRVLISHNVNIHDSNSHPLGSKERHEDFKKLIKNNQEKSDLREAEIIIEDDVWIGYNVSILKGVKIGRGAIIGSGCIISKDVPEYAVIVSDHKVKKIKFTN